MTEINQQQAQERIAECVKQAEDLLNEAVRLATEHNIHFQVDVSKLAYVEFDPEWYSSADEDDWQSSTKCW